MSTLTTATRGPGGPAASERTIQGERRRHRTLLHVVMIALSILFLFPLVFMFVSGAFKNLDNSLNEAAESLGLTAFQRVRQIILPLVMPSLLAGSLLVFMRVFSDFGTPMLIGEGFKTFPVLIYTQFMGEVSTDDHFTRSNHTFYFFL